MSFLRRLVPSPTRIMFGRLMFYFARIPQKHTSHLVLCLLHIANFRLDNVPSFVNYFQMLLSAFIYQIGCVTTIAIHVSPVCLYVSLLYLFEYFFLHKMSQKHRVYQHYRTQPKEIHLIA